MAAPALKKLLWPLIAVAAVGFLALLSKHGERPEPGLANLAPAGILADVAEDEVVGIEIEGNGARLTLARGRDGIWASGGVAIAAERAGKLALALRLARNSGAERRLSANEIAGQPMPQFGLDRPSLKVGFTLSGGRTLTLRFGGLNPIGLGVYAQLAGQDEILLLPAYVLGAWREVVAP